MWSWARAPRWVLPCQVARGPSGGGAGSEAWRQVGLVMFHTELSPCLHAARAWPPRWHGVACVSSRVRRCACDSCFQAADLLPPRGHHVPGALPRGLLLSQNSATCQCPEARLAQPVERKALNLVDVGSSPTVVCQCELGTSQCASEQPWMGAPG